MDVENRLFNIISPLYVIYEKFLFVNKQITIKNKECIFMNDDKKGTIVTNLKQAQEKGDRSTSECPVERSEYESIGFIKVKGEK